MTKENQKQMLMVEKNQQFSGAALNQFLLKRTGITWDSVSVAHVTVNDFRNDSF